MTIKRIIRYPLNLVRASIAIITLVVFFCLETLLLTVYHGVETPLRIALNWIEKFISYTIKYIK
jgi:hypothetical protein